MSGRTPSFIVVGLVIIMLLLGLFYMSCSSKNTELRLSIEQFEDRIRSLTMRNSDSEKRIESINSRKHELEEEKLTIQKQMEKKDSEINDLNTKLNEKQAELQSLKSDKNVLDEQLKEFKSLSDTLASKNSAIDRLQQQLDNQKQSGNDELTRLKQEYEALKSNPPVQNNRAPSNNDQQNNFPIPPERFRPFLPNNLTTGSISGLFQNSFNRLNNLTKEIKADIIPAVIDVKEKIFDAIGGNTNSSANVIPNEQQNLEGDKQNQEVGQNLPVPPLNNNAQQAGHVESAQAAPQNADVRNQDNQGAIDNVQHQQRLQRSLNNSITDNNENDDEEQEDVDNAQQNNKPPLNAFKANNFENNNQPVPVPSPLRFNNRNNDRERYRNNRNSIRQAQQLENGEEVENDDENDDENPSVRKRNVL